uniref:Uncharacterized protein n=1 Tax=Arundo donax TaxID=35708 RepID=A0A0A9C577_ARUDO
MYTHQVLPCLLSFF